MTRSDVNNVLVPFARTDTYKLSFGPRVYSLWNSLPSHIKGITSIDTFIRITQLATHDYVSVYSMCICINPPVYSLCMRSHHSNIKYMK